MDKRLVLILVGAFLVSGCASIPSAKKTAMLHQGMSMQSVTEVLGEPHQTEFSGNKLVWKYDMYSMSSGMLPYYLIFDNSTKKLETWYMNKEEYERNREYMLRASPPTLKKDIDISVRSQKQ